jgi:hypothetical protein
MLYQIGAAMDKDSNSVWSGDQTTVCLSSGDVDLKLPGKLPFDYFFLFVIFIFSGVVKLDYSCDFPLHNKQIICQ